MTNLYDGKGYIPPGDPDTGEEFYYICVAIPRAMEYLTAFFGSLDGLATWKLWARDPAHKGKVAAAVWKVANEITHANFALGECEATPMTFDMRVKPGTPWVTEVSTDGGLTWHDAIIQPHWTAGDQGVPPTTDSSANTDAGKILQRWYLWMIGYINGRLSLSVSLLTIQAELLGLMGLEPGDNAALDSALSDAIDAVDALGDPAASELSQNECEWMDQYNHLVDDIAADPENWLDRLDETLVGLLDGLSDDLIGALNSAASELGSDKWWEWIANNPGGAAGNGAGFGDKGDCDWLVYFAGKVTDTLTANNDHPRLCHTIAFDVPDGYILRGLYLQYDVNQGVSPYQGLYLHVDPDCDAVDPIVPLWEATSYILTPDHNVALVTFDGDDTTPFTVNDLDISGAQEPHFTRDTSEAVRTGPNMYSAAFGWRSRLTETVTGTVGVTVIAQKEGL